MKRRTFNFLFGGAISALVLAVSALVLWLASGEYYDARYPLKYREAVSHYAEANSLPESLVYAVIHTESVFDPDAVSSVDARGLMQITRDTFNWAQHKMGLEKPLDYDEYCFDPDVNIRYGTYLIKILYDEYGSYQLALCAYHAGRGNLNGWLRDPAYSSDGETLDSIPFKDTNWYVHRVDETRQIYQKLYRLP